MRNLKFLSTLTFIGLSLLIEVQLAAQQIPQTNGFILNYLRVPVEEIFHGGPPKDGIPAIDNPEYVSVEEAGFMEDTEYILGLDYEGEQKAFALRILDRHELVNTIFGSLAVTISYCPLCNSGVAFLREINGEVTSFGVSGLLYNSDVLMYDRRTESLWSQIQGEAISGEASGTKLELLPLEYTTFGNWKERYPGTLVLSMNTGYHRNYSSQAYESYRLSDDLMFPVKNENRRFDSKELVIGFKHKDTVRAYPFKLLKKVKSPVTDTIGSENVRIHFDKKSGSAYITDEEGNVLPALTMYWFAWYAFHPDTEVWE